MEINQMKYFRAIVQYGSFSEAASHLHLTQPALSKSMARLEEELGAPLFERKGSRTTLTPAGRVLYPYCGNVLNTVESGITAVRERSGLARGQVTVAISTSIFIKHLILEFMRRYPEVSFRCQLMTGEEIATALDEGQIDFALSEQPVVGPNIDWQELRRGSLTAVLHRDDPLRQRETLTIGDLRERWFCIGHLRNDLYSTLYQLCYENGFEPKIRYLGYDPDMAGMLLELPGSVIVSSDIIDASLGQTGLGDRDTRPIPIAGTQGKTLVGVAMRSGHFQSEAARVFFRLVTDYYRTGELPHT
jgi:DNA-binding transcriptional LysR family regulator